MNPKEALNPIMKLLLSQERVLKSLRFKATNHENLKRIQHTMNVRMMQLTQKVRLFKHAL